MLRLLCCPRRMPRVLLRRLANGLRERLPVLLLLALALGQRPLLCRVHRAAALLRLVWPSPVRPCRAIRGLRQVGTITQSAIFAQPLRPAALQGKTGSAMCCFC